MLGVRLGGSNVYDGRAEDRGTLGDGPAARVRDIAPATRLAQRVSVGSLVVAVAVATAVATTTRHLVRRRGA